jgi:phosphoglycolate phosphatase-like HAD superfamily hydrolase
MSEKRIDTVVWDADNTLWDWISMHLSGMRAMSREISSLTGILEDEVKESMKKVYGEAGTFDYKPLVQNMDAVVKWAEGIEDRRELVSKVIDLSYSTHSAYTYNRNGTFHLYEGVEDTLKGLQEAGVQNTIISDAPLSRIIRRLKHFDIEKYFSAIYGQAEPVSPQERISGECLAHYEEIRRTSGFYETTIPAVLELDNERKPNISFAEKFGKSEDEIADTCAVVGDNFGKDIGLANHNKCLGIYAGYGMPDAESVAGLYEYGPPNVVTRNASIVNSDNLRMIQQMREKVVVVENCREILRHVLGEK